MNSNITIGFSTTNKFMSKVIRFFTRGKVSHAWISFDDQDLNMRMVMQAEWFGFEVRPLNRWEKDNILVAEFHVLVDKQKLEEALQYMAEKLGSKYDYKSAIFSGIKTWIKIFIKNFSFRPSRTPGKLMCSESQIDFLRKACVISVNNLDEETTSPEELLDLCTNSKEFEMV